jgi:alpha-L-fucosidase
MANPARLTALTILAAATLLLPRVSQSQSDPLAPTRDTKSAAEIDREWQQSVAKYDAVRARILAETDRQAADGPYRPDWATIIGRYQQPQWYKDAKFGIFIHWGVYSVPAADSEWFPRNMYHPGGEAYKAFHERFASGDESRGYKDLIPLFKAEKFDPAAWAALFKESGAQYIIPVAEHHDGFAMYDSSLSDWTVAKMGPRRDTLGELAAAVRAQGLHFGLSYHRAEHDWFLDGGRAIRSDVNDPKNASLYGPAHQRLYASDSDFMQQDFTYVSPEFARDWLARASELVQKYHPEVVYFDWWAGQPGYRREITEFTAFYYNYAAAHSFPAVIDIKIDDLPWKAGARDFERGAQDRILPDHWQTDTSISDKSWGYIEHDTYKTPEAIVQQLIDIVSKNGNLLLNIGPRSDGTIPDEARTTLREIGAWLRVNGEAIYGTTPWTTYGEGPTQIKAGTFTDTDTKGYTAEDFRFTAKGQNIYAIGMSCPKAGKAVIHSLGWAHEAKEFSIGGVELLGSSDKVQWQQGADALTVTLPSSASCHYAYTLKLTPTKQ